MIVRRWSARATEEGAPFPVPAYYATVGNQTSPERPVPVVSYWRVPE